MGILKYWLNVARDRLREVTAELPLLLSMSIPLFCKPHLTHALEISLYRDCIPASSPQNPAFLSVLNWQKEDKVIVCLLTSKHCALIVTHSCRALESTLAALKSRMSCMLLLASAALHSKHLSPLWLLGPSQDWTSQCDAPLYKTLS